MEKIYIIGHKAPDLDSVTAAIAYAEYKNKKENTDIYEAAVAGELNKVTNFVLTKFSFKTPIILTNVDGKKIILVDHNEASQSVDGIGEAKIIEVLDHHKVNFSYSDPIEFNVKPIGSTSSIITELYFTNNIKLEKNLVGLLLSAILDDTIITKSPTCTARDKALIEKLAPLAGIADWQAYGMELFKTKSAVREMTVEEIIKADFKDFNFKTGKFGIGQAETVDVSLFTNREEEILKVLEKIRVDSAYHSVILAIVDIINEGTKFLIATSDQTKVEEALGAKLEKNRVYIKGIVSRKKQIIPCLTAVFDK